MNRLFRSATVLAAGAVALMSLGAAGAIASEGWSYEDTAAWPGTCTTGEQQSPIDLRTATAQRKQLPNPQLRYPVQDAEVINNGHAIEAELHGGSTLRVDGTEYGLDQFHVHTPSEHTVNGRHYPVEMHLVNKTEDGQIAVVAVFATQGKKANAAWEPFVEAAMELDAEPEAEATVDVRRLVPQASAVWRYDGSLTTPPCTQGVKWLVMATPVQLSADQIEALREVPIAAAPDGLGNNRPVQDLNGRPVVFDFSRGFGQN